MLKVFGRNIGSVYLCTEVEDSILKYLQSLVKLTDIMKTLPIGGTVVFSYKWPTFAR